MRFVLQLYECREIRPRSDIFWRLFHPRTRGDRLLFILRHPVLEQGDRTSHVSPARRVPRVDRRLDTERGSRRRGQEWEWEWTGCGGDGDGSELNGLGGWVVLIPRGLCDALYVRSKVLSTPVICESAHILKAGSVCRVHLAVLPSRVFPFAFIDRCSAHYL